MQNIITQNMETFGGHYDLSHRKPELVKATARVVLDVLSQGVVCFIPESSPP
jgi:hypothetical protein